MSVLDVGGGQTFDGSRHVGELPFEMLTPYHVVTMANHPQNIIIQSLQRLWATLRPPPAGATADSIRAQRKEEMRVFWAILATVPKDNNWDEPAPDRGFNRPVSDALEFVDYLLHRILSSDLNVDQLDPLQKE